MLVILDAASFKERSCGEQALREHIETTKGLLLVPPDRMDHPSAPTGATANAPPDPRLVLFESREHWIGHILENSKNEIYVFDADTLQFIQVNQAARANLGFTMKELSEMTPVDLKPEYTAASFRQLIAPLRSSEQQHVLFSTIHRRKDGSYYPVDVSLQLSTFTAPPVFVSIALDVTDHFHTELALRESEARAQAILEATADAIVTIDERGTIEVFNRAAAKIFGYEAEEVVGRNVNILMPSPYRDAHDGYLHAYQTTGTRKIIGIGREVTGLKKDGSVFPINLTVSEVHLHDRRIFTALIRDLSEQKQLEREVLEVSAQEQQRLGQDLHDGLGSHLTGVAMSCRALVRRLEKGIPLQKEEIEEIAELVQEAAQQARLLARGLNPIAVSDLGLQSALQELAATMQKLSGIPCQFRGEGDIPPLDAETMLHLYRIAQEGVTNALKHAQACHIWIRLAFEQQAIMLTVQDDGVGLPHSPPGGSGIGYHVMQHRAHQVGAMLQLENAPSGGTLLSCVLPLNDTGQPAPAAAPNSHAP